jgi:hypothetical protein
LGPKARFCSVEKSLLAKFLSKDGAPLGSSAANEALLAPSETHCQNGFCGLFGASEMPRLQHLEAGGQYGPHNPQQDEAHRTQDNNLLILGKQKTHKAKGKRATKQVWPTIVVQQRK